MFCFILVGLHFSVVVVAGVEGILLWFGATVVFYWDDFSIHCVVFVTFITYWAAFFAWAGLVNLR